MDIRFEKVNFTYQPNTPFEQRALFDIELSINRKQLHCISGSYWKWEIHLASAFECVDQTDSGESPNRRSSD